MSALQVEGVGAEWFTHRVPLLAMLWTDSGCRSSTHRPERLERLILCNLSQSFIVSQVKGLYIIWTFQFCHWRFSSLFPSDVLM